MDKHNNRIPKVIPPKSVVKLIRAGVKTPLWKKEVGKQFRIGYYSKNDGLDVIWLVDDSGRYCETTDRDFLIKYFDIVKLSKVKDPYGARAVKIGRLNKGGNRRGKK